MRTQPEVLRDVHLSDRTIWLDQHGYLTDPDIWNQEVARYLAAQEKIELGDLHWEILNFMRDAYADKGIAVDQRFVLKYLSNKYGIDKAGAKDKLYELFPSGYVKHACKIAGMRQPRAWSTG